MLEEPVMPPPSGAVSNFARPQDALHTVNLATQVLCMIVTTIIVLLRIFISAHLRKRLGLEDYMTIAGWVGLSRAFPLFIDDGNRIHEKLELFKVPSGSSRKKLDGLSLLIRAVFKPFNRIAGSECFIREFEGPAQNCVNSILRLADACGRTNQAM